MLSSLPVTTESEVEDTGKDFLVIREDEVRSSFWPSQKDQPKGPRKGTLAAVRTRICGELQVQDQDIGPVLEAVKAGRKTTKPQLQDMSLPQRKVCGQWEWLRIQRGALGRCLQDPRDGENVYQLVVPESL